MPSCFTDFQEILQLKISGITEDITTFCCLPHLLPKMAIAAAQ